MRERSDGATTLIYAIIRLLLYVYRLLGDGVERRLVIRGTVAIHEVNKGVANRA